MHWSVKIDCIKAQAMSRHCYTYKKLRLALGVFSKDVPIYFKFLENGSLHMFTLAGNDEKFKGRNIQIRIAAKFEESQS